MRIASDIRYRDAVDLLNLATPPSPRPLRDSVVPNHPLHVYTGSLRTGTDDGGLKKPCNVYQLYHIYFMSWT